MTVESCYLKKKNGSGNSCQSGLTGKLMSLQYIRFPLRYVKYQENKEIKWAKNLNIIHQTMDALLHRKNIFTDINCKVFVL